MNNEIREFFKDFSYEIVKSLSISYPIEDMEEIINRIGGKVIYTDNIFNGPAIRKVDEYSFEIKTIYKKNNIRFNLQLATLLFAVFFKKGYMVLPDIWKNQNTEFELFEYYNSETIIYSYLFARAFLMPEDEFINKVNEYTDSNMHCNIKEVAKYFNVSFTAATSRGKDLNIIN